MSSVAVLEPHPTSAHPSSKERLFMRRF
jgi:hypothetical protein